MNAHSTVRSVARAFASLMLAFASLFHLAQAADPQPGDDFLRLIDTKKYAESWDVASEYFKQGVSRSEWATQITRLRDPMGDVASRKLRSAEPQTNPPAAPPGEYLLMTYETVFASQGAPRTETLPLIKGADGRWRAVGYFVR